MAGTRFFELIDAVNEAHFWSRDMTAARRDQLARAIAARQGLPGAYGGVFALTEAEQRDGIVLFTGERATSAAARHIAGEEACRALRLLKSTDAKVQAALQRATERVHAFLNRAEQSERGAAFDRNPGAFCCGKCTVSVWRHVTAGGLDRAEERLARGIALLRSHRAAGERFTRFPFWYTVSALVEANLPEARAELKRLRASLERAAKRKTVPNEHANRRREVARRALEVAA
jgi:hypothetical protein